LKVPVVVIVGRPNVGKSTFFNRAIRKRKAVVHDIPGVTRDANYGLCRWAGREFYLVDTGGWVPGAGRGMEKLIREQVEMTLERAEAVVFVVDAKTGMTDLDAEIADGLRRGGKPVTVVANKADSPKEEPAVAEFYALGLGDPVPVSSLHGRLMGDALDRIAASLPEVTAREEEEGVRIAVVGRPNVGKSSLVNALLGEGRMIVHDQPGTTRDAVDASFRYYGKTVTLVDTAGLRKRSRITQEMEFFSALRTIRAVEECDVAFLLLDSTAPVTSQDLRIGKLIEDSGKGAVIVHNKWDLVEKDSKTAARVEKETRERMPFLSYAPLVFVSALTKRRVSLLPRIAFQVAEEGRRRVQTSKVNEVLREAQERHSPPVGAGGRTIKIYYGAQTDVAPPTFTLFSNDPEGVPASYRQYLVRRLRESFGFYGNPIRLRLRRRR